MSLSPSAFAALLCLSAPALAGALTGDHYELALRPDFHAQALEGHARIRLIGEGDTGSALVVASPNLQITRAAVDGRAQAVEKTAAGWQIALGAATGAASPRWLEVDYRAPAAAGLVFGDQTVYTAFHTCQWMPCVGPDLGRATLAIDLDLQPGQRAVASGRPVAGAPAGPGDRRQRWHELRPYPLYTFGFAAGHLTEAVDPADARLRYLGTGKSAPALLATFADSARVLAFLEEKAGVPLPAPVYAQVLVPGTAAQEVSSFSVIGTQMLADRPQDDWVIAHEMAHQWWGNLVTCASWHDVWLDEGIAVFMTAAWLQQRSGEAAYRHEIDAAGERWHRAAAAGFDKPLDWPGEYPNLRTRRDIQYGKAAVFLHTLREALGERAFWEGLRRYTRENVGRPVRSVDLQSAMEAAAGRGLQALFAQWVS